MRPVNGSSQKSASVQVTTTVQVGTPLGGAKEQSGIELGAEPQLANSHSSQISGRRAQESPMCSEGPEMREMLGMCCIGGHRRTQTGYGCTSLPDECSADCAVLFLAFYTDCPSLDAGIAGGAEFRDLCAAAVEPSPPPPPILPPPPPPPTPPIGPCSDSTTWRGDKGQGCGQYAVDAASSWHRNCHVDDSAVPSEAVADSTESFGLAEMRLTAADACRVSCGTCPTCEDRIQNGDEAGVDCGGSCLTTCDPNGECELFLRSGLVPPNAEAICTDGAGVAAGAICHIVARTGFITASIGAAAAACSNPECEELSAAMMVPPIGANPGEYTCTFGKWKGVTIPLLAIVATSCPGFIKENHYSGSCSANGGTCQATCDAGYVQVGGDGVFSWSDGPQSHAGCIWHHEVHPLCLKSLG